MGSSPQAKIGWSIDFGDEETEDGFDWDESATDSWDFEHDVMPALFGFTEEPPEEPDGLVRGTTEARAWWEANRKPYNERREAAIPLTFENYGYELGGTALVLKRSLTTIDWGTTAVDLATLAVPSAEELEAFGIVISYLKWTGAGPVTLLLMATYG